MKPITPRYSWGLKALDTVERRAVDWLWYPYVARKEVTMVEGDPAAGKSWISQILARHACDGKLRELPSPNKSRSYAGMVKVCAFDCDNSIDTITRARLEWAGCEHPENYVQKEEAFSIEAHYDEVADGVEEVGAKIVIFDVVNYYLVRDSGKPDIAGALSLFKKLARDKDCAVILVRWLTKGRGDGRAIQAGQGNMAFAGFVQVIVQISRMPDEEDTETSKHRVFAVPKCKIGPEAPPHDFFIKSKATPTDPDRAITTFGEYLNDMTADDFTETVKKERQADKLTFAKGWLESNLKEVKEGSQLASEIEERAQAYGISSRTLQRAATELGVKKTGATGRRETSRWYLPRKT